jgi:hypothetical protein
MKMWCGEVVCEDDFVGVEREVVRREVHVCGEV